MEKVDLYEPLLDPKNAQHTIYPIKYQKIWESYNLQKSLFWDVSEIDFSKDPSDFLTLTKDEQTFIEYTLGFFVNIDSIVNLNIRKVFLEQIKIQEVLTAYTWQMMMENIHGEVYSLMIESIIKDQDKKAKLFKSITEIPSIKKMADWQLKWIDEDKPIRYKIVAGVLVEGMFFSGAFASIYWFKKYRHSVENILNGLIKSNEFISRDEAQHCNFACLIYNTMENKIPQDEIYQMFNEAVNLNSEFLEEALPYKLIGMNSDDMKQYIKYVADRILCQLNYSTLYNVKNPFPFMEFMGLDRKTSFFESRPTEYQTTKVDKSKPIELLEDF